MRFKTPIPFDQLKDSPSLRKCQINYGSDDLHLERKAKSGYKPFSATLEFDPMWFTLENDRYNPYLATASMGIASCTYGNMPSNGCHYIVSSMENLGFKDIDISSFFHRNAEDDSDFDKTYNLVAYAFGHQTIADENGDPCELVALVVRGTSHTIEWRSNADVAHPDGDDFTMRWHYGFRQSELECLESFKRYLAEHHLDDKSTRIWNLGHSRGAPVANLLGMDLNLMGDGNEYAFTTDHVYTYCIACSMTTMDADANGPAYANIFNVDDPEDFIGLVPLFSWGFRRYGNDVYLPSLATSYRLFNEAKPDSDRLFHVLGGARANTVHGIAGPDTFDRDSADCVADIKEMYRLPHKSAGSWRPFSDFFDAFCTVAGMKGLTRIKDAAELVWLADGAYMHALTYFMEDQILEPLSPIAHNEQHYLARLQTMQNLAIDVTGCTLPDTRRIEFYGPLDLDVLCSDAPMPTDTYNDGVVNTEGASLQPHVTGGRIVSQVARGKVNTDLWDTPNCVSVHYDGRTQKTSVWLPLEGHYQLVLKAYEPVDKFQGTVAAQHPGGPVYAQAAFEKPGLGQDERVILDGAELIALLPDGQLQTAYDAYVESGAFPQTVSVEAGPVPARTASGDVTSSHNLQPGDHGYLRAYEQPGHRFCGWYRVDADGTPGTLVSKDKRLVVPIPADLDKASAPQRGGTAADGTQPADPWVIDNSAVYARYVAKFD